jgi:hypothetical protein
MNVSDSLPQRRGSTRQEESKIISVNSVPPR